MDGVPAPKKEKHDNESTNVNTKKYDSTSRVSGCLFFYYEIIIVLYKIIQYISELQEEFVYPL